MWVFSTITSPAFSELVIITGDYLPQNVTLFETLRKMNQVKPFKLVFLSEVPDGWYARRRLEEGLDLVTTKGFVDFLDSPPTVRTTRALYSEWDLLNLG